MTKLANLSETRVQDRMWLKRWDGYKWIVLTVILTSAIAQRVWIALNQAPPELLDDSDHLWASMLLYRTLTQQGLLGFIRQFLHTTSHHFHPPLIPALTTPFYLLFGSSVAVALWVNTTAMVFFYVYLFRLSKRLLGEMQAAATVIITALFPMTYGLARVYMLEFGLAVIVVIWLYYFYESDGLAKKGYTPWLGLLLGAGLLSKASFPVYIIGPLVWESGRKAWRGSNGGFKIIISRVILLGLIGGLLALPWYWKNIFSVWLGVSAVSGQQNKQGIIAALLSWPNLIQFFIQLLREGISIYFTVGGLILLVIITIRRRWVDGRGVSFLLTWLLPPLLIFTLAEDKIPRYVFPALPAVAALLSIAVVRVLPSLPTRRTLLLAGLLLIPLGNLLQLSFFDLWTRLPQAVLAHEPLGILSTNEGCAYEGCYLTYRARNEAWPLDSMLDAIQDHTSKKPGQEIYGIMRFWLGPLTQTNLMFLGAARNIPLILDEAIYDNKPLKDWLVAAVTAETDYEFLIIERPIITWSESDNTPMINYAPAADVPSASILHWFELADDVNTPAGHYKKIATIPLPESVHVEVLIYQRDSAPLAPQPPHTE